MAVKIEEEEKKRSGGWMAHNDLVLCLPFLIRHAHGGRLMSLGDPQRCDVPLGERRDY